MHITFHAAMVAIAALSVTPAVARDAALPPIALGEAKVAKICLNTTNTGDSSITGSMLKRQTCKTRAEWEANGVKFQPRDTMKN